MGRRFLRLPAWLVVSGNVGPNQGRWAPQTSSPEREIQAVRHRGGIGFCFVPAPGVNAGNTPVDDLSHAPPR
jgi:hypothetical protein